jgi:serine/threonine protein phosphatase PrpC
MAVNGDAFVLKQWDAGALVGVIDGLGHGPLAHQAAQTAWQYVESHFNQPLEAIFRGVERACQATRGVVMALARFDLRPLLPVCRFTFASLGNIEVRLFGSAEPTRFMIRRGVIGMHAPLPMISEHHWQPGNVLILHSDGVSTQWRWEDVTQLTRVPAPVMARRLLTALAKDSDDATVVVVKTAEHGTTPL